MEKNEQLFYENLNNIKGSDKMVENESVDCVISWVEQKKSEVMKKTEKALKEED
jgi:hypothetical protein